MSKINDGGPAYPAARVDGHFAPTHTGMSLRDYFAGQALAGLAAHYGTPSEAAKDALPEIAYKIAELMLAERHKVKS